VVFNRYQVLKVIDSPTDIFLCLSLIKWRYSFISSKWRWSFSWEWSYDIV